MVNAGSDRLLQLFLRKGIDMRIFKTIIALYIVFQIAGCAIVKEFEKNTSDIKNFNEKTAIISFCKYFFGIYLFPLQYEIIISPQAACVFITQTWKKMIIFRHF